MIRHYLRGEPCAVLSLATRVVDASVEARLVPPVRRAPALEPLLSAAPAAVALSAEARLADRERPPAAAAEQQIQHELGQQSREQNHSARTGHRLPRVPCSPPQNRSRPGRGATRRGIFVSRARDDTPPFATLPDAAAPRMMMGGSVRDRHVRFPRFSTAVHTMLRLCRKPCWRTRIRNRAPAILSFMVRSRT